MRLKFLVALAALATGTVVWFASSETANSDASLVGYWSFNEGSGATAADSSGNGNNGTLMNGPVWTTGVAGSALQLDGVNDFVRVEDAPSLDIAGPFTLMAWVNPDSNVGCYESFINKYIVYALQTCSLNKLRMVSDMTSDVASVFATIQSPNGTLVPNTWQHVAGTWDGTTMRLYHGGQQVASTVIGSFSPRVNDNPLMMGMEDLFGGWEFFGGEIDEVKVFNRALSPGEIAGEAGTPAPTPTPTATPTGTPAPTPTPTATPTGTPAPTPTPEPTVLLVHGWDMNSANPSCGLPPLDAFIANSNNMAGHAFKVECLNYRTRDGVIAGAVVLALRIKSLTESAGVDKVDLVAHSEGGLVSRYCVQFFSMCRARVRSLTMIGTPNLGTKIARLACFRFWLDPRPFDQGACDMVPGSDLLTRLNQFPDPPVGIQYHVLMGNLQAIAADLYFGDQGADCIVPVPSANALGFPTDPLYPASHIGIGVWCLSPGEVAYGPIQQRVADFLLQANGIPPAAPTAAGAVVAGVPNPTVGPSSMLASTNGLIGPLQSIDLPVAIPAGMTTAGFFFQVPDGAAALTFTLLRPDGTQVATTDADVTYDSGLVFGELETHYIIAGPAAGTWTMRIYGASVPTGGWPYDLQALVPGGITVTASTDAGHYDTGATIGLAAQVLINDVPLLSATVDALVTKPDDTTSAVALVSDGSGQYLGSFSDTAACGLYQVAVTASGVDGTTPFTRLDRTLAVVGVPGNAILDPCIADSDGDALTDQDEIELYSTNPANPDTDSDGCGDGAELGTDETAGGLRDPLNPWDWYDVNQDGIIDLFTDILGVIQHFSLDGLPPYDPIYDRGPVPTPPPQLNPWNMTAPDGVINLFTDILGVIKQFTLTGCT